MQKRLGIRGVSESVSRGGFVSFSTHAKSQSARQDAEGILVREVIAEVECIFRRQPQARGEMTQCIAFIPAALWTQFPDAFTGSEAQARMSVRDGVNQVVEDCAARL